MFEPNMWNTKQKTQEIERTSQQRNRNFSSEMFRSAVLNDFPPCVFNDQNPCEKKTKSCRFIWIIFWNTTRWQFCVCDLFGAR